MKMIPRRKLLRTSFKHLILALLLFSSTVSCAYVPINYQTQYGHESFVIDSEFIDRCRKEFLEEWIAYNGPVLFDFHHHIKKVEIIYHPAEWHIQCEANKAGCTVWEPYMRRYVIQVRAGLGESQTRRVIKHEMTHVALHHHYGYLDAPHRNLFWDISNLAVPSDRK